MSGHPSLVEHIRSSWRVLLKEIAAFGLVGALAFVLDIGIFTGLTQGAHLGALKSKAVSTVVSTTFAYFGNRHLSFSHRARTGLKRETAYFFAINGIALVFSELILALFVYGFGYSHDSSMVAIVNIVTIGMGTVFRFWAYKRFVFLHPDKVRADADLDVELAE
jgi:putative flippase GtrA